jgi:hypothetical protein
LVNEVSKIIDDDYDKWHKMLKGIYKEVIKDFGSRTFNDVQSRAGEIKAVDKFSVLTEDIENYIDDVTADKVVMITETTKRDIKNIVQNAVQEGQSIPQMKKAIDGLYLEKIIPNRSRTIARTEVVSASNYGSMAGAKQTSSRLKKIWIPTFDDSTRESHLSMANHPAIGLDENFNVGGYYGQYPGDFSLPAGEVINCRCAIGYEYVGLPVQVPPRAIEIKEVEPRKISIDELDNYEDLIENVSRPNEFYGDGQQNIINKEFYKKLGYDGLPAVVNTQQLNEYIKESEIFGYRGLPEMQYVEQLKRGEYFSGTGIYGSGTYSAVVNKKFTKVNGVEDEDTINRKKNEAYDTAFDYAGDKDEGVSKFALSKTFNYTTSIDMFRLEKLVQAQNRRELKKLMKQIPTDRLKEISDAIESFISTPNAMAMAEWYKNTTRDLPFANELDKALLKLVVQMDIGTLAIMEGYDGLYVPDMEYMVIFNRTKMIIDDETGKKWRLKNEH